jgi:hypothetical protein
VVSHLNYASEQARVERRRLGVLVAETNPGAEVTSTIDVCRAESVFVIRKGAAGLAERLGGHPGEVLGRVTGGLVVRSNKNAEGFWIWLPHLNHGVQKIPGVVSR